MKILGGEFGKRDFFMIACFLMCGVIIGSFFSCNFVLKSCQNQCNEFILEEYEDGMVGVHGFPNVTNPYDWKEQGVELDRYGMPME